MLSQQESRGNFWLLEGRFLAWVKGCMVWKDVSTLNDSRKRQRPLTAPQLNINTSHGLFSRVFCYTRATTLLIWRFLITIARKLRGKWVAGASSVTKLSTSFSERRSVRSAPRVCSGWGPLSCWLCLRPKTAEPCILFVTERESSGLYLSQHYCTGRESPSEWLLSDVSSTQR